MAALAPLAVFAVLWIAIARSLDLLQVAAPPPPGETKAHLVASIFGDTAGGQQMVGVFGWLDTPSPFATYLAWFAAIGLVLLLAFGWPVSATAPCLSC